VDLSTSAASSCASSGGCAAGYTCADVSNATKTAGTCPNAACGTGTLFFFDEVSGIERAAWRDQPSAAFSRFVDFGAFPEAVPLGECDAIVLQGSDADGAGVFIAR
jgi:hypothetical protein